MTTTLKTKLHAYLYDMQIDAQQQAYTELCDKLAAWPQCMRSGGGQSHYSLGAPLDNRELELETKHLFDNQWNTTPIEGTQHTTGLRVFDWAEDAAMRNPPPGFAPHNIRRGYWLEQTDAMREIRRNTLVCPYCGKHRPAAAGDIFCPQCIDSEYLTETDLIGGITRLCAVEVQWTAERVPLSDAEKAHLLPIFREAQIHGSTVRGAERIRKARTDVLQRYERVTRNALIERDGMLWLMDHGIQTGNVLFYPHTGRFGFGWRKPYGQAELSVLLDAMGSEFPFPYDIKCADGRTLSGE